MVNAQSISLTISLLDLWLFVCFLWLLRCSLCVFCLLGLLDTCWLQVYGHEFSGATCTAGYA